jgi:hypothetical protein
MQNGTLFTQDFLREGIRATPDWREFTDAEFLRAKSALKKIFDPFVSGATHNEADTEERVIYPVFNTLGWTDLILRKNTMAKKGHEDIPDALFLPDTESLSRADKVKTASDKFRHGVLICEAKKWELPLDQGSGDAVPSTQMLRYLTRADVMSEGRILWGVLTNGRIWRLYSQRAKSRSEQFLEIDLGILIGLKGVLGDLFAPTAEEADQLLTIFVLMFRRMAFLPTRDKGRTFHAVALEEGRRWEAGVAKDLSDLTFHDIFPGFLTALVDAAPDAALSEIRQAAMALLYRLLFILYAEDRDLLPRRDPRYEDHGLFKRVRQEVAKRIDDGATFSTKAAHYWNHGRTLFRLIDEGDADIGLPPYNGGLFNKGSHVLLDKMEIADATFAPLMDKLSRTQGNDKKFINYRDLSVQQLGSIYERLLEYEPVRRENGSIEVQLNPFARKSSGSYYTPDELVALIVDQTVGPLVEERRDAFSARAVALKSNDSPLTERVGELKKHDLATLLLDLKVCDPAMGSGHFLVHLVDYLADQVIEALADAPNVVPWADYGSPLAQRIAAIRSRILQEAKANKWTVRPEQLEDRMIVRRMVLKRVVYGVDKNPMAVELAKVSLWLHTFTVGAPLSFLDHHLRCGDSLFGEWVGRTERELAEESGLFIHKSVMSARQAARLMQQIETATDADLTEVRQSEQTFGGVCEVTEPLNRFLSFCHALKWLGDETPQRKMALDGLLRGTYGDPVRVAAGLEPLNIKDDEARDESRLSKRERAERKSKQAALKVLPALLQDTDNLAEQEHFFHWEVAFPGVWADWESAEPKGGFDAVIGNPPWDRMKMQEVEWFAARKREIALAQRASDRKAMIEALRKTKNPLYLRYELAVQRADEALDQARKSNEYPLLGRGDINIYSLFVERALRLIQPSGFIGLLTPIGIGTDKTAATFFSLMAEAKRIFAFVSFENRRGWLFSDVHHEDQPTVFVVGGEARSSPDFAFGVKLHSIPDDVYLKSRRLTALQCREANPNTGTVPLYRSSKDREITSEIYTRLPILASRARDSNAVWPVHYAAIFHMTNASELFRTKEKLQEQEGAFPISNRKWKSASCIWEPIFEGKMVSIFNHRYASVGVNPKNVSGQGVALHSTLDQLMDPGFVNLPRYWVSQQTIRYGYPYALGFNDVCNTNNARSLISAIVPRAGYGNKLPILMPNTASDLQLLVLLVANLNSFVCDYVARQKIQSRNLNKYILEQLPIVPAQAYTRQIGSTTISNLVRHHVFRLSYTAHDLKDFALEMGHVDKKTAEVLPPIKWDEEERAHLRARLDALYFLLYGVTDRKDVTYILDTFPGVRENDEKAYGRYRTRELILAYMNALEAGDSKTMVAV